MAFVLILIYVILALLSPWSAYPELAQYRIMVWLMAVVALLTAIQAFFGRLKLTIPQMPMLVIFLGVAMLSVAVTGWGGGMLVVLLQLMVPLAACVSLMLNVNTESRMRWLCRGLVLVGCYLTIRGILAIDFNVDREIYGMAETVGNAATGSLGEIYRARALNFLSDPNDFAQYLVACLPLAVLLWRSGSFIGNFVQVVVPINLMIYGIYLTRSRGGLIGLAFLVSLAVARMSKAAAPLVSGGMVLGLLALGFSGGRQNAISGGTAAGRIDLWSEALMLVRSHPIFGIGYNYILDYMDLTAHNSYLLCLVETGILGLFSWLASFSFTFFQAWPLLGNQQVSPEARRQCRLTTTALATAMLTSFFLSRTYSLTLYLFLGVTIAAVLKAVRELPGDQPMFRYKWLVWNGALMVTVIGFAYAMVRLQHF